MHRAVQATLVLTAIAATVAGRAPATDEASPGPEIRIECPQYATVGTVFSCVVGFGPIGVNPAPDGFAFVLMYDSPASTPTQGTAMTAFSIVPVYDKEVLWETSPGFNNGEELCPANAPLNQSSPLFPAGYVVSGRGCSSAAAPASYSPADIYEFRFTANALGMFPVHVVTLSEFGPTIGTYTLASSQPQIAEGYACTGQVCAVTPLSSLDNPTDPIVTILLPPPDVSITNSVSPAPAIAASAATFTITIMNNSTTTPADDVTVADTFSNHFTGLSTLDPDCGFALQTMTCTEGTLAPGEVRTIIVNAVASSVAGAENSCASVTTTTPPADPNPANNLDCLDLDVDEVYDESDNCPAVANTDQLNLDAANTPMGRPGADALGDACDDDDDGDGYPDAAELALTPPGSTLLYCAIMRADVGADGNVSILDISAVAAKFLQSIPPANPRLNQDSDESITILDLSRMAAAYYQNISACP